MILVKRIDTNESQIGITNTDHYVASTPIQDAADGGNKFSTSRGGTVALLELQARGFREGKMCGIREIRKIKKTKKTSKSSSGHLILVGVKW